MEDFLWKLLELSLQASVMTVLILAIRLVFRKVPAKYLCVLWMLVALRLVIPFSFETSFAPMRSLSGLLQEEKRVTIYEKQEETVIFSPTEKNYEESVHGIDANDEVDYYLTEGDAKEEASADEVDYYISTSATVEKETGVFGILFTLWTIGTMLVACYGVFSCIRVHRMVKNAIPYAEGIWFCEGLEAPFLFGWLHPAIYLPCNLEEEQIAYVVQHEKAHIARKDNFAKVIGYVLLSVYWFQPFVWVAYLFFCRDVERACDELAISGYDTEERKGYAEALLFCSVNQKFAITNPLAFGEMDVKNRITSILKYKKPGTFVVVFSVLLCLLVAVGCSMIREPETDTGVQNENKMVYHGVTFVSPTQTPTPTPAVPEGNRDSADNREEKGRTGMDSTLTALNMGDSITMDLNGDGQEETVQAWTDYVYIVNDGGGRPEQPYPTTPRLRVTDLYGRETTIVCSQEENPDVATWYLLDIDVTDGYKEIGMAYAGSSGDPVTYVYRYIDGSLKGIGCFDTTPLEVYAAYNFHGDEAKVMMDALLQAIDRSQFRISVPGDGTITGVKRVHVLETSNLLFTWCLDNAASKEAALVERWTIHGLETYDFIGWDEPRQEGFEVTTKKEFKACKSDYIDSEEDCMITIPANSNITFVRYCIEGEWGDGWVRFRYSVDDTWDSEGFLFLSDGMIGLPDGFPDNDVWPDELFHNLSHAG